MDERRRRADGGTAGNYDVRNQLHSVAQHNIGAYGAELANAVEAGDLADLDLQCKGITSAGTTTPRRR